MEDKRSLLRISMSLSIGMLAFAALFARGQRKEALLMLLLGMVSAGVLAYLPLQRKKEREEQRREELTRSYSLLLTMLSLYMTAGLSLRSSWERMVRQYESERRQGAPVQAVYEEMLRTWKDIRGGEYEDRAYGAFGRRCKTPEYLRLGGMLETYVHQGNRELLNQLEKEAAASFALALQGIKKKGEQTGAKLLLPLLILFGLALTMVIVPALISMQTVV